MHNTIMNCEFLDLVQTLHRIAKTRLQTAFLLLSALPQRQQNDEEREQLFIPWWESRVLSRAEAYSTTIVVEHSERT
jgi:hypothetical protein